MEVVKKLKESFTIGDSLIITDNIGLGFNGGIGSGIVAMLYEWALMQVRQIWWFQGSIYTEKMKILFKFTKTWVMCTVL